MIVYNESASQAHHHAHGNENSKVVALAKNSDRIKPQQQRARFAQQTPRSKRFEIQIRLQVYQRARFYDCLTGEFASQDPLEYVDGKSLYRGYFVLGEVDPYGERQVCCGLQRGWVMKEKVGRTMDCTPGKSPKDCCEKKFATGLFTYEVLRATEGSCSKKTKCRLVTAAAPIASKVKGSKCERTGFGIGVALIAVAVCMAADDDEYPIEIDTTWPKQPPAPPIGHQGKCKFLLAWCLWGNARPKGDKGKGWKRNAPCMDCYDDCTRNSGMWSFGKCPLGNHGGRWRGPDDSVWPNPGVY